MGAQHSKKKRRHQSRGPKTGTTTSSSGSSNLARAAKSKSHYHNPYYGRDVTHERVEVVPVNQAQPPLAPPPTTNNSTTNSQQRPLKTTKGTIRGMTLNLDARVDYMRIWVELPALREIGSNQLAFESYPSHGSFRHKFIPKAELSRSAIVLPTFQDETSVLADLDFMLDSEINLDKIISTPSTRQSNPKDYRRGQHHNRRAKHISRSSSDLNRATRPVNISRSSSNVEKREPISPLGRIPETDYPRMIPRARSANPLYSADQVSSDASTLLKDKLRRYRSHNELDDLEREMRRRNDVLQDTYGLPSNNGYISYESAISRHRPRKSKNITFKEIETNRAKNVEGKAPSKPNDGNGQDIAF